MIRDLNSTFNKIYAEERWGKGKGSGTGSDPKYCEKYLVFLTSFIRQNDIKTVLDIGCGDQQMYVNFDWGDVNYVGCDVSEIALELARTRTNRRLVKIKNMENSLDLIYIEKPDLILCKDVMQHWEDDEIDYFLSKVKDLDWKYFITVNNWKYHRDPSKNGKQRILDRYSWAPIPIDFPSFVEFGFKEIMRYPKGKFKSVMLAEKQS